MRSQEAEPVGEAHASSTLEQHILSSPKPSITRSSMGAHSGSFEPRRQSASRSWRRPGSSRSCIPQASFSRLVVPEGVGSPGGARSGSACKGHGAQLRSGSRSRRTPAPDPHRRTSEHAKQRGFQDHPRQRPDQRRAVAIPRDLPQLAQHHHLLRRECLLDPAILEDVVAEASPAGTLIEFSERSGQELPIGGATLMRNRRDSSGLALSGPDNVPAKATLRSHGMISAAKSAQQVVFFDPSSAGRGSTSRSSLFGNFTASNSSTRAAR